MCLRWGVCLLLLSLVDNGVSVGNVTVSSVEDAIAGLGVKRADADNGMESPVRRMKYLGYSEIVDKLREFQQKYPDLVEVTNAQDKYMLPSPGNCGVESCRQYILRITNERTLDAERPEVFFSGELHGNERVGPTTMMEFAELLLVSYTKRNNPWLQRLVDTRSIYIMPMTNALGYYQNVREENRVDPNRDFPIDKPSKCMQTVTARALNELWKEHMFQLALTFHGGMQAIAFEWGTRSRQSEDVSPDDNSQLIIGSSLSAYAGKFNLEGLYPHNRLNDLVYPVRGGMEDWAYAASWDNNGFTCDGLRDYPSEKTKYSPDQLRALNILIECSIEKIPLESSLGTTEQLLKHTGGRGDGHVPRNLRLSLLMTDIVQPYVQWVTKEDNNRKFSWEVGGSMFVDETYLEYTYRVADSLFVNQTRKLSGKTRWTGGGIFNTSAPTNEINQDTVDGKDIELDHSVSDRSLWPYIPAFRAKIPTLPSGAVLVAVVAVAKVDQAWKDQPHKPHPHLPPQSHVVNARISDTWLKKNAGHTVKGQILWSSDTIVIVPSLYHDKDETDKDGDKPPTKDNDGDSSTGTKDYSHAYYYFLLVAFIIGAALVIRLYRHMRRDRQKYTPIDGQTGGEIRGISNDRLDSV